jgi:transcription elongation factor GreA
MNDKLYLTSEGAARLKAELEQLKGPARQEISERLRSAIQMGDLSENADYHKAKEDQGFLEGKIMELEYLLKNATIIEQNDSGPREVVEVGARITVMEEGEAPESYLIVGAKEADPPNGRISHVSPIGSALMGRRVGDRVEVQTPGGALWLEIIEIE